MKIGIATTDFPQLPLSTLLDRIARYGFDTIQLSFATLAESAFTPNGLIEIPEYIDSELPARILTELQARSLSITAINGTFNMAHPDPAVRQEGVRRFEILAQAANTLSCGTISLCSGTRNPTHLWTAHPDNATAQAWHDMMDTMQMLVKIAEAHHLTLAAETEAANIIDTPERARKMMDDTASPHLKMVMDCANLFHAGQAKLENVEATLRHAFALFGKDVVIAHGKDIRASEGIDFCATGEGIIDYALFLALMRQYGLPCDMILHGIYEEAKMPAGLQLIRNLL